MEEIRILAPVPGRCRVCAAKHRPEEGHDRNSLYYQVRFYQKYRRFPNQEDAAQPCRQGG